MLQWNESVPGNKVEPVCCTHVLTLHTGGEFTVRPTQKTPPKGFAVRQELKFQMMLQCKSGISPPFSGNIDLEH